ncbi:hypothetical protein SAMN05428981_11317 [Bacillus sp. OV194]|nr:hypothetical protein SAMN05428981_11317 [Bacillus sp. OV194]
MKRGLLSITFLVVFSMLLSACALNSSGDNESKDSKADTSAVKDKRQKL